MTAESCRDICLSMEKRWGLDLDMSAVRLMRRDDGVWAEIAVEKIDSPDIEDRLTAMISQIESDSAVELFLPREQILYAQVELGPEGDTRAQIERAMDGRTPYQLNELSLDWELTASGSARVAAIAYETLDEAAAFAEVRGLKVSGYSSLASAQDFPRAPAFDGPNIVEAEAPDDTGFAAQVEASETPEVGFEEPTFAQPEPIEEAEPDAVSDPVQETGISADAVDAVAFTSARKPSRPPHAPEPAVETPAPEISPTEPITPPSFEADAPLELANPVMPSSAPVVHVDDATPVMSVKNPIQPLDPGAPISGPRATPRIRTDIAASTVSGRAASLTPPGGSVKVRRSGSFATTAMIFAVVFLLTVGIATLVWTLLPMSPTGSQQAVPSASQPEDSAVLAAPETDVAPAPTVIEPVESPLPETAAVAPAEEDREAAAPQEDLAVIAEPTPEVPDAPQPSVQENIAGLLAPDVGSAPILSAVLEVVSNTDAPKGVAALPSVDILPAYDGTTPFPETPAQLASIAVSAPVSGPQPDIDDSTDDIYIASIETSDLASDAIALPSIFGLRSGTLPQVFTSPTVVEDVNVPEVTAVEEPTPPEVALLEDADKLEPSQQNDDAMAAAVAQALADALAGPAGLVPTKLASAIPDRAPKARPGGFVEDIERDQFGGRTRSELSGFRPPPRPDSVQNAAAEDLAPPSAQAIAVSLAPRGRPANFGALVSNALVQREAERLSASVNTRAPDTSSAVEAALDTGTATRQTQRLNIPSSASVARQATIENAIPLNKVNLVGVYGAKSNRRALVRLSSGRYVKVQVGDRVDGGTVAQITDSELLYRKGNRTLSLSMPQG